MNPDTSVLTKIDRWVEAGWLSQLNRAFARFLRELEPNADDALLWAGALVSHQLDRGEVYLDLKSLSQQPGLTLAIPSDEDWTSRSESAKAELAALKTLPLSQWQSDLQKSKLVSTGEGNTPLVLDGSRLYLRRYWQYQQTLDRCIQDRLAPARLDLPETLLEQIDALFPGRPEQPQPDWQKIACVLALRSRFAIITGGPGTGKTTTLTKLLALLIQLVEVESPGARKPNILLAAPTGKASARVSESIANALKQLNVDDNIKESIPKKAGTLHRLLGSRPDSRRFKHNRHNPLAADIVIVDEASMIHLEMMASLLEALPDNAQLILLGDKDQLASVEAGSVMGDLCRDAENAAYDNDARAWIEKYSGERLPPSAAPGTHINQQTVMLRYSHRFGEHSGIGRLARAVNAGDSIQAQAILNDTARFKDLLPATAADYLRLRTRPEPDAADALLKKLVTANAGFNAEGKPNPGQGYGYYLDAIRNRPAGDPASYNDWAERVLAAFDAFQVLCALRRGRWGVEEMNRRIEAWLFPKLASGLWYEGRPVMITRNDYNLSLMNGDIGIALYDHTGKRRVAFPADDPLAETRIRWLSPMRLPDAETAFAITVHKSQGSEFNHVVLALPETRSPVLTRELIYTGITRAKENFTLLESREGVFDQAVKARMKNPVDSG
ncbi:exodeoxyribonuclease V subunit alpha [Methylomicrobium lacus]|uniref:exodeoxyribonuclease V subunit alpha n=1 Tax=Methylomicrobium lacus TaxID=136992 RepID=UPI00045EA1A7|nr:exodeoxyribonuclease V subunit alpha [Methylomicrobium lacus]